MTTWAPPALGRIGLVGHSHAVALLDAAGPWRAGAGVQATVPDGRYGDAFQGWFAGRDGGAFTVDATSTLGRPLTACLISGSMTFHQLVNAMHTGPVDEIEVRPALAAFLRALRGCERIVSALAGNDLGARQLVGTGAPYCFALDPDDGPKLLALARRGVQPVDVAVVQRIVARAALPTVNALRVLGAVLGPERVWHVLPPPPLRDLSTVTHHEVLTGRIDPSAFLPGPVRLDWHEAYCRHVEQAASGHVRVVRPAAAARTDEGYLHPELGEGLTHGNAAYGRLQWEHLATTWKDHP